MTPFTGTSLDVTLRALGVHTVVATGVSVNIGVFGMTVEALGLGYRVVIPMDCVAGLPADYATAVLQHSLAPIAELTDSAALVTAWAS
jgi:nicotinamidase-related amidase